MENPETEEPQIFNLFVEEETNQMLQTAIGQLPEQSARIIRLALSGLENKEISRLLKVSVNTVKTLKYSAIRKLREHFQKKFYGIRKYFFGIKVKIIMSYIITISQKMLMDGDYI